MRTTLNEIREYSPCSNGWAKLLKHLGKTTADDKPVLISTIIESNGLSDAIWCLRVVEGCDKEIRLFSVWCARQVEYLAKNARVAECNNVAERYANGLATHEELASARDAAYAADAAAAAYAADAAAAAADAAAADADAAAAAADAADAAAYAADAAAYAAARVLAREKQQVELLRVCKKWESENL